MAGALSRAVFLDRDGVLIEDVDLLVSAGRIRVLPGVPEALALLKDAGYLLLVVSNQTVVARGLADEDAVLRLQQEVAARLAAAGAPALDGFYFCPHHPKATLPAYRVRCECRKPQPGLLVQAAAEHGVDLSASYMVGDRPTDLLAGERAGCRSIWVETGQHAAAPIETQEPLAPPRPDHVCPGLLQAARWILAQDRPRPRLSERVLPLIQDRFQRCGADPGLGRALAELAMARFGCYTGWEIFQAYLEARMAPGQYLLAGAGLASVALLAALQDRGSIIQVVGLIDRRQAGMEAILGCPVLTPEAAARDPRSGVIVCAPDQDKSMAGTLAEAGVPERLLHLLTRRGDFRAFHDAMLADSVAGSLLARIRAERSRVEHVILVPSRDIWSVVDEECLAEVLPPATTIRLYYGPPGRMDGSERYPTFDVHQCLPLILHLLRELDPASVYARGSAQFQCQVLGAAVKALLPGLFLTSEVYDYAGMFDDQYLATWACPPESAAANRDAEAFLGRTADFIIDKTPGAEWEAAAGTLFRAPRIAYFPTLGVRFEPCPAPAREPGPVRILCAGSMPYFENYRPGLGFPNWLYQNIIDPIVALAREEGFRVDIFNASHDPLLDHWPAFGGYAGLFDPGRVGYHPRIPVAEVMARIPSYDFGMFYFQASDVPIDYPLQQSLPNRCMTYIAGDLPIIVNREMSCMADLVERFEAGIVLASTEVDELPGRLRAADPEAMRAGAERLHRHLVERNARALVSFKAALSERNDRVR